MVLCCSLANWPNEMMPTCAGLRIDIGSQHKSKQWLEPLKHINPKMVLILSEALEKTVHNLRPQQVVQLLTYLGRSCHSLPHIQQYADILKIGF